MADPIQNLKANEGLPNLTPANPEPQPLILPAAQPKEPPNPTPKPGDIPPTPPLKAPVVTPPPAINEEDEEIAPADSAVQPVAPLIQPTFVDRTVDETGAVNQGYTPQQVLNKVVVPDVKRQVEAERAFQEKIPGIVDDTTQEMLYPAQYAPPPIVDVWARDRATEGAILNATLRSDEALRQAEAAGLLANRYAPQPTKPKDSAFNWLDAIIGTRNEGPRQYVNATGSVLGTLLYGFGLAQNSVVGAALDVRTQLGRAANAFVPPWLRDNSVKALGEIERVRAIGGGLGGVLTNNPIVTPLVESLKFVSGYGKATDKLNDGKSNFVEALRGAQYSFSDKASQGGVGVADDKGFRVGAKPGEKLRLENGEVRGIGFDVNPSVLAGVAVDVILGGKVDKLLGRGVRKVFPKPVAPTRPATREALLGGNAPASPASAVEYVQPELPLLYNPVMKAPGAKPNAAEAMALKKKASELAKQRRALEKANAKEVKRQAAAQEAIRKTNKQQKQLVLPIGDLIETYNRNIEREFPVAKAGQGELFEGVKFEGASPPPQLRVSPQFRKQLRQRAKELAATPPPQVTQLTLEETPRYLAQIPTLPELAEVLAGRLNVPIKDVTATLPHIPEALQPLVQQMAAKAAAREITSSEIDRLANEYDKWITGDVQAGEQLSLPGLGSIGGEADVARLERLTAEGTISQNAEEVERLERLFDLDTPSPQLDIDWNTRFPEAYDPVRWDADATVIPNETVDVYYEHVLDDVPLPQLPSVSSGRPSYTDYRMNLKKRDAQQLSLKLDVPTNRVPRPTAKTPAPPKGPATSRQGVLFTVVQDVDGIEYRATKAVRDAVDPPAPRPPKTPKERRAAEQVVELAAQSVDDEAEALRIASIAQAPPNVNVVRELDDALLDAPQVAGATPEVQAVAELHNAREAARKVNFVAGSVKQKLDAAVANLDNTPDVGRKFTTERFSVPRQRYTPRQLPLDTRPQDDAWFHGSRVNNLDFAKADPILGGSRSELGLGHYLTRNPDVATSAAKANVADNLPATEGRTWGEPRVYDLRLRPGDKTLGGKIKSADVTTLAQEVGRAFPELDGAFTGKQSLIDVYDTASTRLSEAGSLEFQRHMAAALLEQDYRRVAAGDTLVVIDGTGIQSRNVRVLDESDLPSEGLGHRVVIERDAVAQTDSIVAKANTADAEVKHANQVLQDMQPTIRQAEADVQEAVTNSGLLDDVSVEELVRRADEIIPPPTRSERIKQVLTPKQTNFDISAARKEAFEAHSRLTLKGVWDADDLAEAEALTATLKANKDFNEAISLRGAINRKRAGVIFETGGEQLPTTPSRMVDVELAEAPAKTSIIDTATITPNRTDFPPNEVEAMAKEIARTGRTERIPVVSGNLMDDYRIVSGDLEYAAYQRARELNPKLPDRMMVYVDNTIRDPQLAKYENLMAKREWKDSDYFDADDIYDELTAAGKYEEANLIRNRIDANPCDLF